jgi:hypothetical protein
VKWRRGMIRVSVVLTALWCVVVFGWVYSLAVDGIRSAAILAWEQAKNDCSHETADKNAQCVVTRSSELSVKYDATVGGYLGRILSGESLAFLLAAITVPPLLVLGAGAVVAWVLRGFRRACLGDEVNSCNG